MRTTSIRIGTMCWLGLLGSITASWMVAGAFGQTQTPAAAPAATSASPSPGPPTPVPPGQRILPPLGIELPTAERQAITRKLRELTVRAQPHLEHPLVADAAVLLKAVEWALRHGEFYQPKDAAKPHRLLQLAEERLGQLAAGKTLWTRQKGRVVRGFQSRVDDSFQPYGLVIPEDVTFERPVPLFVWLHGRGDKQTDLHFLHDRLDQDGQVKPPGAIVVHPFGRQCLGYKSAGETDVLEAIAHVQSQYPIDPERIVLMGFSMGGAGAWHLGAHYTDRFAAISPGAGFTETARYTNLQPADYPPVYEQVLWGVYDVPAYVRNLFNRPVVVYSGEFDKQIQAARMMEAAYRREGRELPHLIGPGVEHRYHPDTLRELVARMVEAARVGRPRDPRQVTLQTRTLRYNRVDWVEALGLQQHWHESRIDAERISDRQVRVVTRNVSELRLTPPGGLGAGATVEIDGQSLAVPAANANAISLSRNTAGRWELSAAAAPLDALRKRPGLQGPMDDAFLEPFLVVFPEAPAAGESAGSSPSTPAVSRWLSQEMQRFRERWAGVFRGEPRVKAAADVTSDDLSRYHLVLWGTPDTNPLLRKVLAATSPALQVRWSREAITVDGDQTFPVANHVPVFVFPNPLQPNKYLVVNSGPTFREAHDRTNSLQNPKLPDWVILDVTNPPDSRSAGRVAAGGFFDERWKVTSRQPQPQRAE